MVHLSAKTLAKFLDAVQIIHAHAHSTLHERLFTALDLLYEGSWHGLDFYGKNGERQLKTNVPFLEENKPEMIQRLAELSPLDSPLFQQLLAGETQPIRLSDFVTVRQFTRTGLYQEIFKHAAVTREFGIPVVSPSWVGGVVVGRGGSDFTDEDMLVAKMLSPQIATAFETDGMICRLTPEIQQAETVDFTRLRRLGLSRREAEVMHWMAEGKRDAEIAVILSISARTVNHHVRAILTKLSVETRTAAARLVMEKEAMDVSAPEMEWM